MAVNYINPEATRLNKQLSAFISSTGAAPAQKSKEWYTLKATTIGGSEVATVLGLNPYKTVKALIAEKVGIGFKFNGNIATRWGTVFENVTKEWIESILLLSEPIKETGSIPGVIDRQRYSPDGLGVVSLLDENDNIVYYLILFEFKSPLRSIPDGKIPKQYRPQIQTGMLTIPIVEFSIFVNNCYRKCALKDIGFNLTYDTVFHDGDVKKKLTKAQRISQVYGCGILCFYQTNENYKLAVKDCGYGTDSDSEASYIEMDLEMLTGVATENKSTDTNKDSINTEPTTNPHSINIAYDLKILMNSFEQIIDFGRSNSKVIERLFELIEEKRITVVYYPTIVNYKVVNEMEFIATHQKMQKVTNINPKKVIRKYLDEFLDMCDDKELIPIGYLPWKIIKSDVICEGPEENWKQIIEPPIKNTLSIIDTIMASGDIQSAYYSVYPGDKPFDDASITDGFDICGDPTEDDTVEL